MTATIEPAANTDKFETSGLPLLVNDIKDIITGDIVPVPVTFALEIFTFGIVDGDENHAIYRALLEETSRRLWQCSRERVEYKMLNQLNVDDADTRTMT